MNGYIKRSVWFVISLFGCLGITQSGQAASFDCAKASTRVEKMICGDAALSKLDEELSAAYKTTLQDAKQSEVIKQTQKQWMKKRDGCGDATCVKQVYEARLTAIERTAGGVAPTQETAAPLTQTTPVNRKFAREADKAVGVKRVMAKKTFNISNIASSAGQGFCETFLEDFKEMRGMEFVEPIEKSDKYDDPVWKSYKARCPDLGLFETYDCEPKIADYLDELPQDEQKQAMKSSCRHFRCTENFKLFRVDAKGEGGGVDNIFYCERMHGPLNFLDIKPFDTHGRYQVVDLKHCQTKGMPSVNDSYGYSHHRYLDNYNGVIAYKGKHYTFDLSEIDVEARTSEKTEYNLEVWGYTRVDGYKQPKFLPKCFFSTAATH